MNPEPTGRHRVGRDGDEIVLTRTFRAGIDDVWAAITESDRLARWIGVYSGDPSTGSVDFTMTFEGDENLTSTRYDIVRCDPPRLLQVRTVDAYGQWDLTAELVETDGVTTLTFSQVVHDPAIVESVGPGWEYYLDRLGASLTRDDPAAIDFDDYYPAQRDHYLAIAAGIGTHRAD
ncbi:SRPBCC family protein [Gordonia sp. CPCC 205515]|uniref:SRPBCC family protein n=1 Tax=Gordonia sp. CPCC 205515 TaxID=3140791 RepID=UPI003AF3F09A